MGRRKRTRRGAGEAPQAKPAPEPRPVRRRPAVDLAVAAALLALAWLAFHRWKPPNFILLPIEQHLPVAPLYAFFMPLASAWALVAAAVLGLATWAWPRVKSRRRAAFLLLAVLFCVTFRLAVHAARKGELPGAELAIPQGEEVLYDVPRVESAAGFLRDYVSLQPELSLHGRTKPPGYALLYHGLIQAFDADLRTLGLLLTLMGGAIVLPVYVMAGRLSRDESVARAAAWVSAAIPSGVLYGAVTLDAVFALLAATVFAVVAGESAAPRPWRRALLGGLLCLGMMLTYSTFLVGLLCAVLLVARRWREPLRTAAHLAQVGGVFLLSFVLLYLVTGFNAWECFRNARRLNAESMGDITGRHLGSAEVWLYSSVGNLLAFLLLLGVPVVAGCALLRARHLSGAEGAAAVAGLAALAAACFGGLYVMETERILLFLTPLPAWLAVRSPGFRVSLAVPLMGAQALAAELILFTIW